MGGALPLELLDGRGTYPLKFLMGVALLQEILKGRDIILSNS